MSLDPKDPDIPATYTIDWHDELIGQPLREMAYAVGAFVQAQLDTGWYYECTTAGRTSSSYPRQWPREAGLTVKDGSAVWTARHPSLSAVPAVSAAAWTVPAGITKDAQAEGGVLTHIMLSGGTDGQDYDILCRMTSTAGGVFDRTITVPVRNRND